MGTNERLGVQKRKANGRNGFLTPSLFLFVIFPLGDVVLPPVKALILRLSNYTAIGQSTRYASM